jgi:hypothetical protein
MPFSLASWPPVYTAVELHAAAQLPPVPPVLEDEEEEDDEDEDDEEDDVEELDDPPESCPMYCHRLVVVGFQPVEL